MNRLPLPARRPWPTVVIWAVAVGAMAVLGTGITARLAPTSLLVPGTTSARTHAMLDREFGNQIAVTFLLEGPPQALERQGRDLAAALAAEGDVRVMSPWQGGGGALAVLHPRPDAVLLVANFQRPEQAAMSEVVPTAKRIVAATVHGPVRAYVGGVAAIATALQENALAATSRAELIVAPILIFVLLLVFRSPLAAAIPLLLGGATVAAGRGLLLLSTYAMPVNAIAVAIASMMGLALGVDYALLMVSRFRQERAEGATTEAALSTATASAGRTIVFAGLTLALVMVTAALVAPGDLLASVAAGVVVSTLLSVALAVSLLPALLAILAPHLERWHLPSRGRGGDGRLLAIAGAAIARPWIAIPAILLPMLAIAAPAAGLSIGSPDPRQLPPSDPTRQGFEALRKALGPGWAAPITVIATAKDGPISAPGRLQALWHWQDRLSHDPDVAAVIGPTALRSSAAPLRQARRAYRTAPARLARARRGLAALSSGLTRAGQGVEQLRAGLERGAGGAAGIAGGTRQAESGAERLGHGFERAGAGAGRLADGLTHTRHGAGRLVRGQHRLQSGARRLAHGLRRIDREVHASQGEAHELSARLATWSEWLHSLRAPTELAVTRLESGLGALDAMTVGREDPRYAQLATALREAAGLVGVPGVAVAGGEAAAAEGAAAVGATSSPSTGAATSMAGALVEIEERLADMLDRMRALPEKMDQLAAGVAKLRRGSGRLAAGAQRSRRGGEAIRAALARLQRGGRRLARGLDSAQKPSRRLGAGLGELAAGAERLAGGLEDGAERTGALSAGLRKPQQPLHRYGRALAGYQRRIGKLQERSPGAADSGYLLLTALDGTVPGLREQASQLISLDRGGRAVRMLVVPRSGPGSTATHRLGERLQREVPALAAASGTEVAVGEGAQSLADYTDATVARIPWLILALCSVSGIVLVAVLRSLLLPVVAVVLNMLTIAAAFGALQLFFDAGLMVGPPYIDAISAAGVMTIMFVLSIDYEVFLLTRIRETWLATGDHELAISEGLAGTAGVITGAATIMCSVFLVFATAKIASLQQFGAGLAFAVILDATVVRLMLLPALMRVLGPRAWWLPGWLDRLIPEIEHNTGSPLPPAAATPAAGTSAGRLEAASHEEHRRLLELLGEVESAGERHDAARVITLVEELRRLAQVHFSYEQSTLFPHLAASVGAPCIEEMQAAQGSVVEALARIEALAGPATVRESAAAETRLLLRSARRSVISCDALCEAIELQDEEVAEAALVAREQALAAYSSPTT